MDTQSNGGSDHGIGLLVSLALGSLIVLVVVGCIAMARPGIIDRWTYQLSFLFGW